MSEPVIRKATHEDLQGLTDLADRSYRAANADALPPATLEALTRHNSLAGLMANRWDAIWVAETEDGMAGIASADEEGHVWLMYVDPDKQGRGVGSALHDHLLTHLEGTHPEASLDVLEGNKTARAFYEHKGWTEESRREVPLPGATCVAIRMVKALPN